MTRKQTIMAPSVQRVDCVAAAATSLAVLSQWLGHTDEKQLDRECRAIAARRSLLLDRIEQLADERLDDMG